MKIGIFGDSFCNKNRLGSNPPEIWYNFLQEHHGHEIDCFGEAGSSILFSADLIRQRAVDYDLVVWCVTTPGRFSFPAPAEHTIWEASAYHVTSNSDVCNVKDIDLANKHQAAIDYLKHIFDWPTEDFVGRAIVYYIQSLFSNIMVIPCFPAPLESKFNLYDLSQREIDFYFPGRESVDIFKDYFDMRIGHLTLEHHKILADLINNNLTPGVFETRYDLFPDPTTPRDDIFKPPSFTLPPLP